MSSSATQPALDPHALRRPPLIIPVPPPRVFTIDPPLLAYGLVAIGCATTIPVVVLAVMFTDAWLRFGLPTLLILAVLAAFVIHRLVKNRSKAHAARRTEFDAGFPDWEKDPVAARLAKRWRGVWQTPTVELVLEAIHAEPLPAPPRARLICLGVPRVPDIGALRFEPLIVTPTRFMWKRLFVIAPAVLLLVFWLAARLGWLPGLRHFSIVGFTYPFVLALGAAGAWFWRTVVWPTYLRFAPGMVQVVQFGWVSRKPDIRSYPMTPGTVAILAQPRGVQIATVHLLRGRQRDQIPLWQMKDREEVTAWLWQALLSTAPTPPLSDEDLLG